MVLLPLLSKLALSLHCPQQKNHYACWHTFESLLPSSLRSSRFSRSHKTHALLGNALASLVQPEGGLWVGKGKHKIRQLISVQKQIYSITQAGASQLKAARAKAEDSSKLYSTSNRIQSDNLSKHLRQSSSASVKRSLPIGSGPPENKLPLTDKWSRG